MVGGEGAACVAIVRRQQKLHPCLTVPVPASSKTDPPLFKAEPIRDFGNASVIMHVRRGKNAAPW